MKSSIEDLKVLIVDDEADLLELLCQRFEIFCKNVLSAPNGQVALQMLNEGKDFDLIISDVRMPVMNGVELLKNVRSQFGDYPLFIFTSGFMDTPLDELYDLGANGLFPKPVESAKLIEVARKAIKPLEIIWGNPPSVVPRFSIHKKLISYEKASQKGLVRLGKGGFFVKETATLPVVDSMIRFDIEFAEGFPSQIRGTGYIRWKRSEAQGSAGCGIEIHHLYPQQFQEIIDFLKALPTQAIIPKQ